MSSSRSRSSSSSSSRQNLRSHRSRPTLSKTTIQLNPADFEKNTTTLSNLLRNNPHITAFEVGIDYAASRSITVKLTSPIFVIEINPADIKNENEKRILKEMIYEKYEIKDTFLLYKDELKLRYIKEEDDTHYGLYIYKLSNNLLIRKVKEASKNPDELRCEIIANKEFAAATSKVFFSNATLKFNDFSPKTNPQKKRLVKIIDLLKMKSNYKSGIDLVIKEVEKEYQMTLRAKHHIKPPVFDSCYAFLVMELLPGKLLEEIIVQNFNRDKRLSVMKCLQYGLAILHALKNQVHDNGIIHRDIKPGNILLWDNNTISAYIFDFGLAKLCEDKKFRQCGSPLYMSPETAHFGFSDEKSDLYAVARILAELLGFESSQIKTLDDLEKEYQEGMRFDGMFFNPIFEELDDNYCDKILVFLKKASDKIKENRYSLPQATEELETIIHDIKNEYVKKFLAHAKNVEDDLAARQRCRYLTFKPAPKEFLQQKHEINTAKKMADIIRGNENIHFNEHEWEAVETVLSDLTAKCESLGLLPDKFFMAKEDNNLLKKQEKIFAYR